MSDTFDGITITRFEAGEQDGTYPGLLHFRFKLSHTAPSLWQEIAGQGINQRGWKFIIQRRGEIYSTEFVIGCAPQEAQRIKDALNKDIVPYINQEYRTAVREAQQEKARQDAYRATVMSAAEKAVREQR